MNTFTEQKGPQRIPAKKKHKLDLQCKLTFSVIAPQNHTQHMPQGAYFSKVDDNGVFCRATHLRGTIYGRQFGS